MALEGKCLGVTARLLTPDLLCRFAGIPYQ